MTQDSNGCISLLHDYRQAFTSTQGKGPFPTSDTIKQKCPKCTQEFEKLGKKFTYGNLTKVANCIEKKDGPKSVSVPLTEHPKVKALTETLKPKAMEKWPTWLIFVFYFLLLVFSVFVFVLIVRSTNPFYNHRKHLMAESMDSYISPSASNERFYKSSSKNYEDTPIFKPEGIPIESGLI